MKKLFWVSLALLILQGCVISTTGFKTDNGFFLTVRDRAGNEINTGASVNDPEYVPELEKMYTNLVQALEKIIREQKK